MALVALESVAKRSIARLVGAITSSMPRRRASTLTASITGRAPAAPVPITSRRQLQGISSSADSGVGPAVDVDGAEGEVLDSQCRVSPSGYSSGPGCANQTTGLIRGPMHSQGGFCPDGALRRGVRGREPNV